jgi:hypothetical protein
MDIEGIFDMNFKQYLEEMSIAAHGDWRGTDSFFSTISLPIIKKWKKVGSIGQLEVRKFESTKLSYVAGYFSQIDDKQRFRVVIRMELERDSETESMFPKYGSIHTVIGVITDEDYRGQGIGKALYSYIVNKENISLLGDSTQYFGARKLWASISKESTIVVDLLDVANGRILDTNVVLNHGDLDSQFDTRLWSREFDKVFIRPIMKSIK